MTTTQNLGKSHPTAKGRHPRGVGGPSIFSAPQTLTRTRAARQNILTTFPTPYSLFLVLLFVLLTAPAQAACPTGDCTQMTISDTTGNVGIGTADPILKLRVHTSTPYDGIGISNGTNEIVKIYGGTVDNDGGKMNLMYGGVTKILLNSNNYSYFNSGNVGIFTITPTAPLEVSGTISATTLQSAGTIKMGKYTSQPLACSSTYDGYTALTSQYTTCVCKGGSSAWVKISDGSTACSW